MFKTTNKQQAKQQQRPKRGKRKESSSNGDDNQTESMAAASHIREACAWHAALLRTCTESRLAWRAWAMGATNGARSEIFLVQFEEA